jgi:excisionase family DNA binding protein
MQETPVTVVRSEDPLLTVAEAATHLAVAESWLYDNWKPLGVPAIKLGRQLRFRRSALDTWLDGRQAAA